MVDQNIDNTKKLTLMIVDDEVDILKSLKRTLRKDYEVIAFDSPISALEYLNENMVDIVLSDMRMPDMDGADFLTNVKELHPTSMRLILSGYSEVDAALKAINEANIYAFLTKPWDNDELKRSLSKAVEYYTIKKENLKLQEDLEEKNSILSALNEELDLKYGESTDSHQASVLELHKKVIEQKQLYKDLVEMLSKIISYRTGKKDESGSTHVERIAHQCRLVANVMEIDKIQCNQIYVAALVHELGMLGLKDEVFEGKSIRELIHNPDFLQHPEIGAEILSGVKRLSVLSESVLHQNENYDGTGTPNKLSGIDIPAASRIIRVVRDYDYMVAGVHNPEKIAPFSAKKWLQDKVKKLYDPRVVSSFLKILKDRPADKSFEGSYCVGLEEVRINDVVKKNFVLENGSAMLKEGQVITAEIIQKLKDYEESTNTKIALFI